MFGNKRIAFFTEMQFKGKIGADFANMRTEFAYMHLLDAFHHNISTVFNNDEILYDVAIVILPKSNPNFNLTHIKKASKLVCLMQEGPNWFWQDWPLAWQIEYINLINGDTVDMVLCHNTTDKNYYQGLTSKPVYVLPTAMIPQAIEEDQRNSLPIHLRQGTIIGGNMVSWYGGMDSFLVAKNCKEPISAPSMGRKTPQEQHFDQIQYLPYVEWASWMKLLRPFKYAVHLMRTYAAGTFALNCAYYGIPCIGYKGLDTQQLCHPGTTVEIGDIKEAKKIAIRLSTNPQFYEACSTQATMYYQAYYSKDSWYNNEFYQKIINT